MQVISKLAEERKGRSVFWYQEHPGQSKSGNDFPNITGVISLTGNMLNKIVEHGKFDSDDIVELSVGAYENNTRLNDKHPSHLGSVQFKESRKEKKKVA